jgi:hypothetical protein
VELLGFVALADGATLDIFLDELGDIDVVE